MNQESKPRILVVDDEVELGSLVSFLLHSNGFTCDVCTSGEEALLALEARDYQVVLSDIVMPGYSGPDVLRLTRQKGSKIPFIFLTAYHDTDILQEVRVEAFECLLKPFEVTTLITTLQLALQYSQG